MSDLCNHHQAPFLVHKVLKKYLTSESQIPVYSRLNPYQLQFLDHKIEFFCLILEEIREQGKKQVFNMKQKIC